MEIKGITVTAPAKKSKERLMRVNALLLEHNSMSILEYLKSLGFKVKFRKAPAPYLRLRVLGNKRVFVEWQKVPCKNELTTGDDETLFLGLAAYFAKNIHLYRYL